jgi:hypothetical protein
MIIELDDNEMCLVINAVYVYKHNTYRGKNNPKLSDLLNKLQDIRDKNEKSKKDRRDNC